MNKTIFLLFFLILISASVSASEIFKVPSNSCGSVSFTQNNNDVIIKNNCFSSIIEKKFAKMDVKVRNYDKNISFLPTRLVELNASGVEIYDFKLNKLNFTEFNATTKKVKWDYNGAEGTILFFAFINNNKYKWEIEITNWPFSNSNNYLVFESEIKANVNDFDCKDKKCEIKDTFVYIDFQNPWVNDVNQEINIWLETKSNKTYLYQKLGNGTSIILDPTITTTDTSVVFVDGGTHPNCIVDSNFYCIGKSTSNFFSLYTSNFPNLNTWYRADFNFLHNGFTNVLPYFIHDTNYYVYYTSEKSVSDRNAILYIANQSADLMLSASWKGVNVYGESSKITNSTFDRNSGNWLNAIWSTEGSTSFFMRWCLNNCGYESNWSNVYTKTLDYTITSITGGVWIDDYNFFGNIRNECRLIYYNRKSGEFSTPRINSSGGDCAASATVITDYNKLYHTYKVDVNGNLYMRYVSLDKNIANMANWSAEIPVSTNYVYSPKAVFIDNSTVDDFNYIYISYSDGSTDASDNNRFVSYKRYDTETDAFVGSKTIIDTNTQAYSESSNNDIFFDTTRKKVYIVFSDSNAGNPFISSYVEIISLGETGYNPSITADFTNTTPGILDPDNSVNSTTVTFTTASTDVNVTEQDWNWTVNGVVFSSDQNTNKNFTTHGDYNIGYHISATDIVDGNWFYSSKYKSIQIKEYPQDVNFTWLPITPIKNDPVVFTGTADINITNWQWKFGDGNITNDGNVIPHTFTSGDFNSCLNAQNAYDLNRQVCYSFSISGAISMYFFDENTNTALGGVSVIFNGNTYTANGSGIWTYNMAGITNGIYTISAYDATHSTRTYTFYLTSGSSFDFNAILLKTIKGRAITFKFYGSDEITLLGDANISIRNKTINKYAYWKKITNASGEITFFLNPEDANYQFEINDNTGDYNYVAVKLVVKPPKRESNKTTITPIDFDVELSFLSQQQLLNNTEDANFYIYSNTTEWYNVTVDANADFFERKYDIKVLGDENVYVLQPYLVAVSEGVSTKIVTQNIIDFSPIPNVKVDIYKYLSGEGRVLVETVVTDYKGEAFISGQTNDKYEFEIYYNGNLMDTVNIVVTSTTIYIQFNPTTPTVYEIKNRPIVSFVPSYYSLLFGQNNLQQIISPNGTILSSIRIYVLDANGNSIYDLTFGGVSNGLTNTINIIPDLNAWDYNLTVTIIVSVSLSDGNVYDYNFVYAAYNPEKIGSRILDILRRGLRIDIGCSGDIHETCPNLVIIALIITLLACGGLVAATPLRDPAGITAFAVIVMAFFTYLGWVPILWMVFFTFLAFAGLLAVWRFG